MKWKIKAYILMVISLLPGGRQLYHLLQRAMGTNKIRIAEGVDRSLELVKMIHEQGRTLESASVVEVGTGWRPVIPFVFSLLGTKVVRTYDVNPWLTFDYAYEVYTALADQLERIADGAGVDIADVRQRYADAKPAEQTLAALLAGLNVEYIYPGDASKTGLPADSIDFVVSSNVLEHIPPKILADLHVESRRILGPTGLAVHRYNPGDHFVCVDRSITCSNFLQFSVQQWNWLGGRGLSYHNRLRGVEHSILFEQAGFVLAVDRDRVDERAMAVIKDGSLKIHDDFKQFTNEELAIDYKWTVAASEAN